MVLQFLSEKFKGCGCPTVPVKYAVIKEITVKPDTLTTQYFISAIYLDISQYTSHGHMY